MQSIKQKILKQVAKLSRETTKSIENGGCLWVYTYEPKMPESLLKKRTEVLSGIKSTH